MLIKLNYYIIIQLKSYNCEELNCLNLLKLNYNYNTNNINIISFNLYNNFNPSGSINFSALNKIYLRFYFKSVVNNYNLLIIAKNYNVLKTISGMGNKLFNN